MKNKRLGEMLVDSGAITEEQLQAALAGQKATGKRLGTYLIDEGIISEKQFVETLRMQLGVEFIDLNKASIDPTLTEIVPKDTARTYRLIPVKVEGNNLYIAMEDPMNFRAVEAVRQMTGRRVIPMIAYYDAITASTNAGLHFFSNKYKPLQAFVVGNEGIPLADFLQTDLRLLFR